MSSVQQTVVLSFQLKNALSVWQGVVPSVDPITDTLVSALTFFQFKTGISFPHRVLFPTTGTVPTIVEVTIRKAYYHHPQP